MLLDINTMKIREEGESKTSAFESSERECRAALLQPQHSGPACATECVSGQLRLHRQAVSKERNWKVRQATQ